MVDLRLAEPQDTNEGVDTLERIENVEGSDWPDTITGNALDNEVRGLASDDVLAGDGGDDILIGGELQEVGGDRGDGGAGNDTCYEFEHLEPGSCERRKLAEQLTSQESAARSWAEGCNMSIDEAVESALSQAPVTAP